MYIFCQSENLFDFLPLKELFSFQFLWTDQYEYTSNSQMVKISIWESRTSKRIWRDWESERKNIYMYIYICILKAMNMWQTGQFLNGANIFRRARGWRHRLGRRQRRRRTERAQRRQRHREWCGRHRQHLEPALHLSRWIKTFSTRFVRIFKEK